MSHENMPINTYLLYRICIIIHPLRGYVKDPAFYTKLVLKLKHESMS